jgi:5-aminopentanamidase
MRICCWQTAGHDDLDPTLVHLRAAAGTAASVGARLLITPELSMTGYRPHHARRLAEPGDGRRCRAAAAIAAECDIAIVYGWPELADGLVHNAARLVDRHGTTLATYRKTHLFGAVERAVFAPGGRGIVQAVLGELTIGLLICYDVEFPEAVRAHALAGTQLLAVPAALTEEATFIAGGLLAVRAFESQLFIAYVNRIGIEDDQRYCGLTKVVGPDGRVVAGTRTRRDELLVADLDLARIAEARRATTYLRDRRPDLYPEGTVECPEGAH